MRHIREISFSKLVVLLFCHSDVAASVSLLEALTELSSELPEVCFVKVDLEVFKDAPSYFSIDMVPTTLLVQGTQTVNRIEGADTPSIISSINHHSSNWAESIQKIQSSMYAKIESIINQNPVCLFIKGSPEEPKCKFTRRLMQIMKGKEFGHFDILEDDGVREWMKRYSNWPTFPQVYVKGEMLGGVDIIEELNSSGELDSSLALNS